MSNLKEKIEESLEAIHKILKGKCEIGMILGTGLGELSRKILERKEISYQDIPHFLQTTALSHVGKLVFGKIGGKAVIAMEGRFHFYEGYALEEITYPVRVMRQLGCRRLIVSNAAGGLNPAFSLGDLMVITDHINLMGVNPLIGPNEDWLGVRFPDMSEPYTNELIALTEQIALEEKIKIQKGVYVAVSGPCLETRDEYRFLRTIGADVVGMSTIPEVIVAVHSSMRVLGLSVVTDSCFPDALEPVDIQKILKVAAEAEPKLTLMMKRVIERV